MTGFALPPGITLRAVAFGGEDYGRLLQIRDEVLRRPIGMVLRDKDTATDRDDWHLAAFDGDVPVGCVLLKPLGDGKAQLRQMAVLDGWRGRHLGTLLAGFAEEIARAKGFASIETRARRTAEKFYRKLGYQSLAHLYSDEHTLLMRKPLAPA